MPGEHAEYAEFSDGDNESTGHRVHGFPVRSGVVMANRNKNRSQRKFSAQQIIFALIALIVIVSFILAAFVNF